MNFNQDGHKDKWTPILGNPIDREGDVIYRVGISPKTSKPVLSAHAINTGRWALGCVGLLAGFIVAIASGIVLGFIKKDADMSRFILTFLGISLFLALLKGCH